ncbi:MAG TPA: ATP-dependent Clp protease adapter ClpS [Polyangiaceae bacterium]|nr:ATP-dependent Clp protease adapter ClpS [Polyangiaceae bacterium]
MASTRPGRSPAEEGDVEVKERPATKVPRRYQVVFHNDDYTPMEFVVFALMKFFHKDEGEATHLMLQVHHKGSSIVGVFSRDVAETKVSQVMDYAREKGHPLLCTAEPEGFE